jgi:two-component system response regulator NreC
LSMPRLNGVDAAREIRRVSPRSKVIMLTNHRDEQYVLEAINAGIIGYVLKSGAATAMHEAIQAVTSGQAYLSPEVARFAVKSFLGKCTDRPAEVLSPRELQVLQLIAEGNTTREIAAQLKLTLKTAVSCRMTLMDRLDIHETASLVRYAVRSGLIKP